MKSLKDYIKNKKIIIKDIKIDGDLNNIELLISESSTSITSSQIAKYLSKIISENYTKIVLCFKDINKYIPGSVIKPVSLILFNILQNYFVDDNKKEFKNFSVDAKKYDDNSFLCIVKINETTISFLIEKEK
jgi:hypothetical protein